MKKDNIYSSAGTKDDSSTNAHDKQVSQPNANEMLYGVVDKREIKFLGKSAVDGKWVYGFFIKRHGINEILTPAGTIPIHPWSVVQYTGLKDKNGKYIYEGDVIRMHNVGWEYTLVKFHNGVFAFYTTESKYLIPLTPQYWEEGEIMGNIFENPELLTHGSNAV